jgi:hypothetical protein
VSDRIEESREPWQAIPRAVLRDARLSPAAKGGLVTLLSHEAGWIRSCIGVLQRENRCGRTTARSIMRELVEAGYATLDRANDEHGHIRRFYVVTPHVQVAEPAVDRGAVSPTTVEPQVPAREVVDNRGAVSPTSAVLSIEVDPRDEEPQNLEPKISSFAVPAVHLCAVLHDRLVANGVKKNAVTQAWIVEAERMLRIDGRDPGEAETVLRWSQADPFWHSNILSMPKFRKQYDQLRLKMSAGNGRMTGGARTLAVAEQMRAEQHLELAE